MRVDRPPLHTTNENAGFSLRLKIFETIHHGVLKVRQKGWICQLFPFGGSDIERIDDIAPDRGYSSRYDVETQTKEGFSQPVEEPNPVQCPNLDHRAFEGRLVIDLDCRCRRPSGPGPPARRISQRLLIESSSEVNVATEHFFEVMHQAIGRGPVAREGIDRKNIQNDSIETFDVRRMHIEPVEGQCAGYLRQETGTIWRSDND